MVSRRLAWAGAYLWRIRRKVALVGLAGALTLLPLFATVSAYAGDHQSSPSPPVNTAIAENTTDGSSLWALAFQMVTIATDVVDPSNIAIATSNCTACSTVAIAIQIVFVTNPSPPVVTPGNAAVAVNYGCFHCTTVALAYQFLVMTGGEFKITHRGRKEIEQIHDELQALQYSGKTPLEQASIVNQLMQQLAQVLATEVVPEKEDGDRVGPPDHGSHASPSPAPPASPTASPSAAPGSPTPVGSPLPPTANPSPSPTTSTNPSPSPSA